MQKKNQEGAILVKLWDSKAELEAIAEASSVKPTPLAAAIISQGIDDIQAGRAVVNKTADGITIKRKRK